MTKKNKKNTKKFCLNSFKYHYQKTTTEYDTDKLLKYNYWKTTI